MSSSSSFRDGDDLIEDPVTILNCWCSGNTNAKLRESWNPKNPARRFFNCKNSVVPYVTKCKFYKWMDDEIPKHYKIVLRRLKALVDSMKLEACRSELAAVKAKLLNAESELSIQTQLRVTENETADATIHKLRGEVSFLTNVNASLMEKLKNGLMFVFGSMVVVAGVGSWFVMDLELKKGREMQMLWG